MFGYFLLMSLAGTVFATGIFFDSPTPTEPHQVSKFFTIQYVTSTVALSPHTVTETVHPTCTITASSIPVCGEASVGIIFTSGGVISPLVRPDVTTTEKVPITTAISMTPNDEDQTTETMEITTSGNVDVNEVNIKNEDSMTTTSPLLRFDLSENEIDNYDYSEVETTTFINLRDEMVSTDIPDDEVSSIANTDMNIKNDEISSISNTDMNIKDAEVSSISNTDMNIKNDEEQISVTTVESTNDEELMSILNAINSSPQTSVVPMEDVVMTKVASESDSYQMPLSPPQQQGLPLSTSYEMATVVLPSCDCPSGRQPRMGDGADIITFMTTKTIDVATVTVSGMSMYTIQYAGCVPEDAVVTSSCV